MCLQDRSHRGLSSRLSGPTLFLVLGCRNCFHSFRQTSFWLWYCTWCKRFWRWTFLESNFWPERFVHTQYQEVFIFVHLQLHFCTQLLWLGSNLNRLLQMPQKRQRTLAEVNHRIHPLSLLPWRNIGCLTCSLCKLKPRSSFFLFTWRCRFHKSSWVCRRMAGYRLTKGFHRAWRSFGSEFWCKSTSDSFL